MSHILAFRTRLPASGPAWLSDYDRSVVDLFRRMMPGPFTLHGYGTAELPGAADYDHSLVYDHDVDVPKYSNGTSWITFSVTGHTHTEADITLGASDRLVGRDTAGAGAAEELTVGGGIEFTGSGGIQRSALSGDVTASAGSAATTIAAGVVTYAKFQNVATDRLLGRDTAGAGVVEELTVSNGLEFTGTGIQRSALAGDVSAGAGSNTTAIGANKVTDAMLRQSAGLSVIGRAGNTAGNVADVTAANDGEVLRRSGTALAFGTVATAGITDDAVTYAKIQNVSATDKLLGRSTSGAGDVEEIACTAAGRALLDDADANAQRQTLRSAALVEKSANETGINASAGGFFISWDQEAYDDGGYHDNVTNNSRLTTLSGQTRVRIGCTIAFANVTASSQVSVAIYKNGSSTTYSGRPVFGQTSPSATIQPTMTLASGPVPVTGGTDYFQVALFCSDTSVDVTTSSSFWIEAC